MHRRPLVALLLAAGCRVAPASLPEAPHDAATSRAALATVVVDNRTTRVLAIGYQYLESGGGTVVIGRVGRERFDTIPPVPAREPIRLFARDSSGAELRTAPTSLELDAMFVWLITTDAVFAPPGP